MFCSCVHLQVVFNESNDAFQVVTSTSDIGGGKGRLLLGTAVIISTTVLHYNVLGMRKISSKCKPLRKTTQEENR